jgi:hypothetical protein
MKHRPALAAALMLAALTTTAQAAEPETHACNFKIKARCVKGDASVTLAGGKVIRVVVDVYWCGLPGRPGYSCLIDSSRGDADAKWSEENGATVIDNTAPANPADPDRMKVTVGLEVSIDLAAAQSLGRCGAGAELPRTILIPAKKAACRVKLGGP